ncbi:phage tail protein [Rhodovibrio salinarum]|uniref:Phage tail collar domain-containing protein n=1 Tax=Rhodovibrio salinarum TaxID=1087 RepID=A0A934QGA7_9PROT|nr:tail fiber protein [Rhodovibrio salinarum]MBK1696441.1 hypothetical protein [Rhodovibrio salinarum]
MTDVYTGQIILFGGNFTILNFAECAGGTLTIPQNTALYSLLSTIYGGDGRSTFKLPDLRGRAPVQTGTRPGGSTFYQGTPGGTERVGLTVGHMPPHNHAAQMAGNLTVSSANGSVAPSSNTYLGAGAGLSKLYTTDTSSGTTSVKGLENASVTVDNTGGGQPVETMSPYLPIRFQIALSGLYPSRS